MTDALEIEKNVPVPPGVRTQRYPFADMNVGDSVRVPAELLKRVRSASDMYGRRHGVKFTCRKTGEQEWRLWRIA